MKKLQLPKEELLKIIKEELSQIMAEGDPSSADTEINQALQRVPTEINQALQRPADAPGPDWRWEDEPDLPRVIGVIFERLKTLQAKIEALEPKS